MRVVESASPIGIDVPQTIESGVQKNLIRFDDDSEASTDPLLRLGVYAMLTDNMVEL